MRVVSALRGSLLFLMTSTSSPSQPSLTLHGNLRVYKSCDILVYVFMLVLFHLRNDSNLITAGGQCGCLLERKDVAG